MKTDKEPSLVQNAGDASQVKEARKTARRRIRTREQDLKNVLASLSGRRYLWNLWSDCGVFESEFLETNQMFFRNGERNIGLRMLSEVMRVSPDAYQTMIKESARGDYDV